MKRFLEKRWHHLPVGIITAVLLVCLVAGSAFAAFNFTGMNVTVEVDEPLQVQYMLEYEVADYNQFGDSDFHTVSTGWQDIPPEGLTLEASFSAGDVQTLYLRMNNRANSELTVGTVLGGNTAKFDLTGFPGPQVIAPSDGSDFGNDHGVSDEDAAEWTSGGIPIGIMGDAAPGTYTLTIEFERS